MRLLIVGGGGREHALAWRFKNEAPDVEIYAAPGNPGIADLATCVAISPVDLDGLLGFAKDRNIDLTVVGPEAPLERGIVDLFRAHSLPIFGPTRSAAEIETSKAFAKQMMLEEGIPTARAEVHNDLAAAMAALRTFGLPVVVKASGLASGKGVIVCATLDEADRALRDMLSGNVFGDAGHEVLIEEFMEGEEISIFAVTNGSDFVLFPGLQDHKRLLDGDVGPNTGGMGAYLPVSIDIAPEDVSGIFRKTLDALAARDRSFTGLLYAGLMITAEGAKVVEFNCRFGDPETQALMPALPLATRVLDLLAAVANGTPLPRVEIHSDFACVTTVLAAANYPGTPAMGDAIGVPPPEGSTVVFHAGTARNVNGELVTAGGRVLAVSATAATIATAQEKSQAFADRIQFAGKQMRTDIGWREIARATRN